MAKIVSPPKAVGEVPGFDIKNIDGWEKAENEWLEKLRKWCKKNGSGDLAGEVVREAAADGYAQYMVFKMRPLTLIHLPLGDAWHFRWAHKWNAADIRDKVKREKSISDLFSRKS
jgi:hypothetical protein